MADDLIEKARIIEHYVMESRTGQYQDLEHAPFVMSGPAFSFTRLGHENISTAILYHLLYQEQHLSIRRKGNVHKVLVTCFSMDWNGEARITERPDLTLAVDCRFKALFETKK